MKKYFVFFIVMIAGISAYAAPASLPNLVTLVRPSVVSIKVNETLKGTPKTPNNPFGMFLNPFGNQPRQVMVAGSGFIIAIKNKKIVSATPCNATGVTCYVITNNHVIRGAKNGVITIEPVSDGNIIKFQSKIIASDAPTDLAILSIPKHAQQTLRSLSFGDSEKARIGETVIAIGNPLGRLPGTVSEGIISAQKRNINEGPYDSFIQTDTAINRGNSGGPLIDMRGHVIGINTAIYSSSGGSEGIGFAIPSNRAQLILNKLIQTGKVKRAALGIVIQPITPDIALSLGLPKAKGALIQSVSPIGPSAGKLKSGDVIVAINGKNVISSSTLPWMVAQLPIGQTININIYRNRKYKIVHIKLSSLDVLNKKNAYTSMPTSDTSSGTLIKPLGISLKSVKIPNTNKHTLVVSKVNINSKAYFMGVRKGMYLTQINLQNTNTLKEVKTIINKVIQQNKTSGSASVMLTLYTPGTLHQQGRKLFLGLTLKIK